MLNELYKTLLSESKKRNIIGEITFDIDNIKWSYYPVDTHNQIDEISNSDYNYIVSIINQYSYDSDVTISTLEIDENYACFYIY